MVERCVYEQPAYCNAACPLKLDTRAMLKAAADGNFKKALQLYEKIAPFPLVLSQGCEAPCEGTCRLGECGDGVAVRAVEQAVARFGEQSRLGGVFRSAKKQKAAVFGSGLFALFLAGELEKKMYPVTVFCAETDEEAFLRGAAPFLDEAAFALELKDYGYLQPFTLEDAENKLRFPYDKDGYWYPVRVCNMVLAYNPEAAEYFLNNTDSAAVYVNASTRFTDGGEFGLGCEMGISTQKMHARGPMGLEELMTYHYVIKGNGQVR